MFTCFSSYLAAEDTGALSVLGSNCKHVRVTTLQPIEGVERVSRGVVDCGPFVVFGLDEVVDSALWTQVPADCDVIVAASGDPSHISRWTNNCRQDRSVRLNLDLLHLVSVRCNSRGLAVTQSCQNFRHGMQKEAKRSNCPSFSLLTCFENEWITWLALAASLHGHYGDGDCLSAVQVCEGAVCSIGRAAVDMFVLHRR